MPPSSTTTCPVSQPAASAARNSASSAASSGVPNRPSGIRSSRRARAASSGNSCATCGVTIGPGASALTRMPLLAELHRHRPGQRRDGALAGGVGVLRHDAAHLDQERAHVDDRRRRPRRPGAARRACCTAPCPCRLTDEIAVHSSRSASRKDTSACGMTPALLNSRSSPPNASTQAATAAATCSSSRTSAVSGTARPRRPRPAGPSRPPPRSTASSTPTAAPSRANASALARPIAPPRTGHQGAAAGEPHDSPYSVRALPASTASGRRLRLRRRQVAVVDQLGEARPRAPAGRRGRRSSAARAPARRPSCTSAG